MSLAFDSDILIHAIDSSAGDRHSTAVARQWAMIEIRGVVKRLIDARTPEDNPHDCSALCAKIGV